MHIVPLTPPYVLSASVPIDGVPKSTGAVEEMLIDYIARPLSQSLTANGYTVGDLHTLLEGSQITVDTDAEPGHAIFTTTFPHPDGNLHGEIHPLRGIEAELIGGYRDGTRIPNAAHNRIEYPPATNAPGPRIRYTRTGYNLTDGSWAYQFQKAPARRDDKAET